MIVTFIHCEKKNSGAHQKVMMCNLMSYNGQKIISIKMACRDKISTTTIRKR